MRLIGRLQTLGAVIFAIAPFNLTSGLSAQEVDYKRQLLKHLEDNQPIAGTFEITTTIDPEQQAKLLPALGPVKPGTIRVPEATDQLLKCRWAWGAGCEASESLEGSLNTNYGLLLGAAWPMNPYPADAI